MNSLKCDEAAQGGCQGTIRYHGYDGVPLCKTHKAALETSRAETERRSLLAEARAHFEAGRYDEARIAYNIAQQYRRDP